MTPISGGSIRVHRNTRTRGRKCLSSFFRDACEVLCIAVVYIAPLLGVLLILLMIEIWLLSKLIDLCSDLLAMMKVSKHDARTRQLLRSRSFCHVL